MRYVGQSYELTVDVPKGALASAEIDATVARFHADHERVYGHSALDEPVEFVSLRVTTVGRIRKPRLREVAASDGSQPAPREERDVFFAESGGYVSCPIYDRYSLRAGAVVEGPAVIEEFDTTTVIHPQYQARVDRYGNLLLTKVGLQQGRPRAREGARSVPLSA
jgi:N-methylhydantoinase A